MESCDKLVGEALEVLPDILLEEKVIELYGCDPAHGWPHILRVARWARRIALAEGLDVDYRILYYAVLLHDIGRVLEGEEHHAVKSARFAESELLGLVTGEELEQIKHVIEAHSYSLGVKADSVEAKLLSDADKLDALGGIGIARAIHTGCLMNRSFDASVEHMKEKLLRLPGLMNYKYSRIQAEKLVGRVRLYITWCEEE